MSGARLDGLEGMAAPSAREDYQAGQPAYDAGYVTALVEAFSEVDPFRFIRGRAGAASGWGTSAGHRRLMSLLEQVPEQAGADAAGFLDGVIMQAGHTLERLQAEFSYPLFSEIIGRLYRAGHNGFLLDYTDAPALASQMGAYGLVGTKENPLSITVLLPAEARSAAQSLTRCVLTVLGDAFTVGIESLSSEFIIHGKVENFGQRSEGCAFRLKGAGFVSIDDDSDMGAWAEVNFYRIRLTRDGEEDEVRVLNDFFERGNRLYVGDDSCWTEVGP